MSSSTERGTVQNESHGEPEQAREKLRQAIDDAVTTVHSLEREIKQQKLAVEELGAALEARQQAAATSLATAAKLVSALKNPSVLWSEVVRDIAQLGDGRGHDELVRALHETSAIFESFIGKGSEEKLVKRIDEVIEMLGGE